MNWLHSDCLTDEELRAELEARDTIVFDGAEISWQEVSRQVERLGFGDAYILSSVEGTAVTRARITLHPK
jgi:hypothetical protein